MTVAIGTNSLTHDPFDPSTYASAILNILDDATADRRTSDDAVKATLNILDDLDAERSAATDLQQAMLNVLEDAADEKGILEATQKGILNILEDFEVEKNNVERANRDLDDASADLQRANGELESFSYSVAHDLRAPLRAIDGFSQILLEDYSDRLDEEGRRLLGVVVRNVGRMGVLIDDLLTFSRLARAPLARQDVDMTELVRSVLEESRQAEPDREVEVAMSPLGIVLCDPATMRQVWINLVSNALKFSRHRTVAKIQVARKDGPAEAVFSISDNGAGFDMRYAAKLFGVFQRLHAASEFEGTGIGLAIVGRVVQRHLGRAWGEGEVDAGATFSFALPLWRRADDG